MGFGLWVLGWGGHGIFKGGFGHWNSGFEFLVLSFWLGKSGFEFWVLG